MSVRYIAALGMVPPFLLCVSAFHAAVEARSLGGAIGIAVMGAVCACACTSFIYDALKGPRP